MRTLGVSLSLGFAAALAISCESSPDAIVQDATVRGVDVRVLESFPVQVHAAVAGELPDGCTELRDVETTREGNEFHILLTTERPADAFCTLALRPFEELVVLDVLGLPAGRYRVVANGVVGEFELQLDNSPR